MGVYEEENMYKVVWFALATALCLGSATDAHARWQTQELPGFRNDGVIILTAVGVGLAGVGLGIAIARANRTDKVRTRPMTLAVAPTARGVRGVIAVKIGRRSRGTKR